MLFREVINLIYFIDSIGAMGDPIKVPAKRLNIFADKHSIRQSEFYQAMASGLRPELQFIIRTIDYQQEPQLEYNDKIYNIIRTYEKENEFIELICQGITNGVM
jgi:SPP1 family predicted phage head-tail adaptor